MKTYNNKQEYAKEAEVTAKKVLKVIGFVILGIAVVIGFGFVVKALWNWLMPEIFGLKKISYWQGIGILLLAKIFFGSVGGNSNTNSKSEERKGDGVRGAYSQALHEEMQQEFYKEYDKKHPKGLKEEEKNSGADNIDQEKLYEKWWAEEGEAKFEDYLRKVEKEEL